MARVQGARSATGMRRDSAAETLLRPRGRRLRWPDRGYCRPICRTDQGGSDDHQERAQREGLLRRDDPAHCDAGAARRCPGRASDRRHDRLHRRGPHRGDRLRARPRPGFPQRRGPALLHGVAPHPPGPRDGRRDHDQRGHDLHAADVARRGDGGDDLVADPPCARPGGGGPRGDREHRRHRQGADLGPGGRALGAGRLRDDRGAESGRRSPSPRSPQPWPAPPAPGRRAGRAGSSPPRDRSRSRWSGRSRPCSSPPGPRGAPGRWQAGA